MSAQWQQEEQEAVPCKGAEHGTLSAMSCSRLSRLTLLEDFISQHFPHPAQNNLQSQNLLFSSWELWFFKMKILLSAWKNILKESSKSGLIKMPFRNNPLLMEVLSLRYVLKQFTPITSGHILGNKDCLTCISRRFYFW